MASPNPAPFIAAARRYGSESRFDAWAREKYGVSGPALLAKVAKGESGYNMGAVSSAGARGGTQFMPGTRAEYVKRYGVDPWAGPDQAVHGTKLYLEHDSRGLAGYNPGDPSYTSYILGQKVGDLGRGRGAPSSSDPQTQQAPQTQTQQQAVPGFGSQGSAVALLAALGQQSQRAPVASGGLASPAATAAPVMPGGYAGLSSSGGPAPKRDVSQLLAIAAASAGQGGGTQQAPQGAALPASATTPKAEGTVGALVSEAKRINDARVPYLWGGGHAAPSPRGSKVTPLDCSGAVSRVLGINPKVASEFKGWGEPGGGSRVTVYANDTHVLMKIDGHFFGTSRTNPGGGAGWIPQKAIPASYLKNFTARHPAGL